MVPARTPGISAISVRKMANRIFMLKSESCLKREQIFVVPALARYLFTPFESILSFENQILAAAIAQTQAQTPEVGCRRAEKIVHVSISDDRKPFIHEDLAEPRRPVELA